jgi:hypothetical protein
MANVPHASEDLRERQVRQTIGIDRFINKSISEGQSMIIRKARKEWIAVGLRGTKRRPKVGQELEWIGAFEQREERLHGGAGCFGARVAVPDL